MERKMESKKRALVIGAGAMGSWIARRMLADHDIWITDIDKGRAAGLGRGLSERFIENPRYSDYEMIISAVNLSSSVEVMRKLRESNYSGTAVDISSLKKAVNEEMSKLRAKAVSVHPLFGPGAGRLEGKTVLLVPVRDREAEAEISSSIFSGARIVEIEAELHDRLVAHTIQLTHILSLIASRLMVHDPDLMGTGSRMMHYVEAVSLHDSSRLIQEMLSLNPASRGLFDEIREALSDIERGNSGFKETDDMKELYERIYNAIDSGCI